MDGWYFPRKPVRRPVVGLEDLTEEISGPKFWPSHFFEEDEGVPAAVAISATARAAGLTSAKNDGNKSRDDEVDRRSAVSALVAPTAAPLGLAARREKRPLLLGGCDGCTDAEREHEPECSRLGRRDSRLHLSREPVRIIIVPSGDRTGDTNLAMREHVFGKLGDITPEVATLVALQRSRSMAVDVGRDTRHGWPMLWRKNKAALFGARPDGVPFSTVLRSHGLFLCAHFATRKEALGFIRENPDIRVSHFGKHVPTADECRDAGVEPLAIFCPSGEATDGTIEAAPCAGTSHSAHRYTGP